MQRERLTGTYRSADQLRCAAAQLHTSNYSKILGRRKTRNRSGLLGKFCFSGKVYRGVARGFHGGVIRTDRQLDP